VPLVAEAACKAKEAASAAALMRRQVPPLGILGTPFFSLGSPLQFIQVTQL
jgi:hypothetical protein